MLQILERTDIERFRSIVTQSLGLRFDDSKLDFLAEIMQQRMESAECGSGASYLQRLSSSAEEIRAIAEKLTVCETYFFRYTGHFRAFADVVIPQIRARGQRRLRILSAGCASGEEAYSLAMLIRDELPDHTIWDITILGIDVNASMLAKASRARYHAWAMRDTSGSLRAKYFRREGTEFQLNNDVRSMVRFEERNLADENPSFWQQNAFDVVFCRNVTMYLTFEVTRSVVERIAKSLSAGGFLFMGHAETLRGVSQNFHLLHTHEAFYYQRHDVLMPAGPEMPSQRFVVPVQALADPDNSWFDIISKASERIATLTTEKHAGSTGLAGSTAPRPSHLHPQPSNAWNRTAAMELLRNERFAEALQLLRELPPGPKADPDAQLLLAALLTNHGKLAEAEKVCMGLLQLDELNAGAHYLIALCREHLGDQKAAVEHDQIAVYLDPAFAMPHLHLGLVAKRSGNVETATRELGQALALLVREDASRVLLFGGGFDREALSEFCQAELLACRSNQ
jgi:chemotaxis protein methyltransferase CheR